MKKYIVGGVGSLLLSALTLGCLLSLFAAHAHAATSQGDLLARGKYLVAIGGCNDCHTPLKMGPQGPEPDMTRMLSGHPQGMTLPPPPTLPAGPWVTTVSATNTAWSGPWGVSFTANLTPDRATGFGNWTERMFIDSIRTGKHLGQGRPILPPMPIAAFKNVSDADLKALFAYLQSIPAIRNQVPEPLPPPASVAKNNH